MDMENILESISGNVPVPDTEYEKDGLLHCVVCHEKTQTEVEFMGVKKKVRCICKCKQAELEKAKERERREEIERNRMICFAESNMAAWNFENDDRHNEKISDAMKRYAEQFPEFRGKGEGLLLYGGVGTGKTYMAACIANALIDSSYTVFMTNFARIANKLQGMYEGKQEYIDSLNRYALLIIDDLGAERDSPWMKEIVFNIIDARYRSGLPFIITTNLSAAELKSTNQIEYSRIYDRILERCFPVEVKGASRRRESLKATYEDTKAKLGL